ncbi:DUF427-domain-containing protein [Xylaria bambusicola]|uniref:DUF427-domain-containing protein n=1 Tax=Xylaria bambusicola TaxID=326684 RepID=UPI0020082502|nr:DUF427-domain-containing protein [Xylaria bambusicola]KAI0506524.1 DUF427-domain-containing protein [Xylaria bambusicola]
MPPPPKNLDELARSLLANGPVKTLPAAPKRVRVRLGGTYVADTTRAVYVWEHAYYPTYYVPRESFAEGVLSDPDSPASSSAGDGYRLAILSAGGASTDRVIVFRAGVLKDLVRVEFSAVDAWFEEDARIDIHPKDPFKRVDVVFSSRPVRILVRGTEVARAPSCFQLYETGLPVRFYLPVTSVRLDLLRESATVTACPYKGEANYYDVLLGGAEKGMSRG